MDWQRVTDTAGLRAWHAVTVAANELDHVAMPADPLDDLAAVLVDDGERSDRRHELWSGTVDGTVVAAGAVQVSRLDNLDEAEVDLTVLPSARGRGHGAAAVSLLLARCRELGRTRVVSQVPGPLDGSPSAGDRLALRCGFAPQLAEVRRLLDVAAWSWPDEVRPVGYDVVAWVEHAPDDAAAGLAALAARMSTDAPQGGLAHEPEVWDAARWRAREDDSVSRGRLRLGAHAVGGGEVVAYSDLAVHRTLPAVAYQWDTLVRPDHRGHGLGLALKVTTLRRLRAASPGTRWLTTWNAAENVHMIAINEALGFRAVDRWTAYERRL